MTYIVVEIQKYENGQVGNLVSAHGTKEEAESKYHSVLAAAAVSALPVHSAVLISEEGYPMRYECYKHPLPEPEPEPELETEPPTDEEPGEE